MMFYKETDFRDSPIGKVPKDWEISRLGVITENVKGRKPARLLDEKSENSLPYLKAEYMRSNSNVKWCERDDPNIVKVNDRDLIMIWDGSYSGDVFTGFEGALASTMVRIIPEEKLSANFLYYFLSTKFEFLRGTTSGTGVPHVSKGIFENLLIPLPPLVEQRAIVGVLGVVDSAIQKTDEVIAKTERLKKGLMQELLTKGIGYTEYKDTPIGKTPKTWQTVKLGDVLELCQYGLSAKFGESGEYPILKMDDIVNGVAIPDNVKYIDLDEKTFSDFKLEKGDILFNRTNSYELVGRTGIFLLDGNYVFASYLIRLRPKKEAVDSKFLTFYMTFANNRLRQLATRAVHQANINATNLQNFKIPLPPLLEQQKIAEIISEVDKKLMLETKEEARFERIRRGLIDLLLTGRVRVEV